MNRNNEKHIQTQLRYWANKLAMKKSAECVILTYTSSDDSLNGAIFVNNQIANEFNISKNPKQVHRAKKCTFEYWDQYDNHVQTFDSLSQAAKFFGWSRRGIQYHIDKETEFEAYKPYTCKVKFLYWGE